MIHLILRERYFRIEDIQNLIVKDREVDGIGGLAKYDGVRGLIRQGKCLGVDDARQSRMPVDRLKYAATGVAGDRLGLKRTTRRGKPGDELRSGIIAVVCQVGRRADDLALPLAHVAGVEERKAPHVVER